MALETVATWQHDSGRPGDIALPPGSPAAEYKSRGQPASNHYGAIAVALPPAGAARLSGKYASSLQLDYFCRKLPCKLTIFRVASSSPAESSATNNDRAIQAAESGDGGGAELAGGRESARGL